MAIALITVSPLVLAGLVSTSRRLSPAAKNAARRIRENQWFMKVFNKDRWMSDRMEHSRALEGYYDDEDKN